MSISEVRRKSTLVMLRMTPEERAELTQRAADVKLSLPAYLIACGLARKTRTAMDDHIVQELRLLGEQQRAFHRTESSGGEHAMHYRAVLVELIAAIRRIGA